MLVGVLRLAHVHNLDARGLGRGQTGDAVGARTVIQRTREDRGGVGAGALGLVGRDVVVAEDRGARVGRNLRTAGQLDNLVDGRTAQGAEQRLVAAQGTRVHGQVVHLAVLVHHEVHQLIQDVEAEVGAVRAGGRFLTGGAQLDQARELVARAGAVDQLVLVLAASGLRLGGDLDSGLVVAVAGAGSLDQAVHFGVTHDGGEVGVDLGEGRSALTSTSAGEGRADTGHDDVAQDVLAVVREAVAFDGVEGQHVEHAVDGDDVFDHASNQFVLGQLGAFGKGNRSHDWPSFRS